MRVARDPSNPDSLDSVCLDEISFARFANPPKRIVPVMVKPCKPPFCIFRLDYVDLCAWKDSEDRYQRGLDRLLESLRLAVQGAPPPYRQWDDRLKPWDFSVFLGEKRKGFSGREWLFEEIDAWRVSGKDRVLLITGDPGIGKSAIVAELVHRNPGGQVLAYHCCQADTLETLQPGRFVRSIAAMIASDLAEYAEKLKEPEVEEALSEARAARDPGSALEAGVLTPLQSLPAPADGARYLLIDALDEALSLEKTTTILDVLATRLNRFPPWLRIVLTSRRDPAVLRRLSGLRGTELQAEDSRNLGDIDRYIERRLCEPALETRLRASRLTVGEVRKVLNAKAGGNFLYVQRALDSVEMGEHGFDRLHDLPRGLHAFYASFFRRHFPDDESYKKARRLLEVVVAAREPLNPELITLATGFEPEYELPQVLRPIATYAGQRDGKFSIYHKSFADWLTSDREDNPYYVSQRHGHERLAGLCDAWERQLGDTQLYALKYGIFHLERLRSAGEATVLERMGQRVRSRHFRDLQYQKAGLQFVLGDLLHVARATLEEQRTWWPAADLLLLHASEGRAMLSREKSQLLERARRGDVDRLDTLLAREKDPLSRFLMAMIASWELAENGLSFQKTLQKVASATNLGLPAGSRVLFKKILNRMSELGLPPKEADTLLSNLAGSPSSST